LGNSLPDTRPDGEAAHSRLAARQIAGAPVGAAGHRSLAAAGSRRAAGIRLDSRAGNRAADTAGAGGRLAAVVPVNPRELPKPAAPGAARRVPAN
jgi:hypothetical protein